MSESRAAKIQHLLISRLERQIEGLKKENENLQIKLVKKSNDSAAKIYLIEEQRNAAQRSIMQLEQDLELERAQMRRIERLTNRGRKKG